MSWSFAISEVQRSWLKMSLMFRIFAPGITVLLSWYSEQQITHLKLVRHGLCRSGDSLADVYLDVWSTGCVMAELMLGQPLFPGESGIDQLVEIIKVLGTPTREQIRTMNPNYMEHKFPQIKPHPFSKVCKLKFILWRPSNISIRCSARRHQTR